MMLKQTSEQKYSNFLLSIDQSEYSLLKQRGERKRKICLANNSSKNSILSKACKDCFL